MQSHDEQAHASSPFRSRQRLRACASRTFHELEVILPVGTFLGEGRRTVANLYPPNGSILEPARHFHVAQVLVTGNRTDAECLLPDRLRQSRFAAGSDTSCDDIPHGLIVPGAYSSLGP